MAAISGVSCNVERFEEYLDRATDEVFSTMMGLSCVPDEQGGARERERISALIGLAGAMSGSMVLHIGHAAAMRMAEHLTGAAITELDEVVRDAIGEVCNMVAGTWKGFDPVLCAGCMLSTPTVVAGSSYEVFSRRAPLRIERSYRFEDQRFTMTLYCEPSL